MAHLRPRYRKKDGKKVFVGYYGEFYDRNRNPKRKWVSLRTKDKVVARARLADWERAWAMKERDPWVDTAKREGVTFEAAKERYLRVRSHRRARTQRADRSLLKNLSNRLGTGFMVAHVEPRHMTFVIRDGLKESTRRTYHARLSAFFGWCVGEGLIEKNPLSKMRKPRVKRKAKPFLSRDQYAHLLSKIEAGAASIESGEVKQASLKAGEVRWLADVVRVAVGTGLRLGELCHLRWGAVDLAHEIVMVKEGNGFSSKSGHERTVPVAGDALATLRKLSEARTSKRDDYVFKPTANRKGTKPKLDERYVSRRFKKYAGDAKLPEEISFHSLRHTYASWLAMAGVDIYRVKELLGHASIETTMVYAHLAPDQFANEVKRVFE